LDAGAEPPRCHAVVSVVIPAHNEEAYLTPAVERVVEAMQARDYPFEIIVCENGSTDLTTSAATDLARRHPETVKVLSLPEPDYGRALCAGFRAASGDLVVNFDVDLVDFDFFDKAVDLATRAPQPPSRTSWWVASEALAQTISAGPDVNSSPPSTPWCCVGDLGYA